MKWYLCRFVKNAENLRILLYDLSIPYPFAIMENSGFDLEACGRNVENSEKASRGCEDFLQGTEELP